MGARAGATAEVGNVEACRVTRDTGLQSGRSAKEPIISRHLTVVLSTLMMAYGTGGGRRREEELQTEVQVFSRVGRYRRTHIDLLT